MFWQIFAGVSLAVTAAGLAVQGVSADKSNEAADKSVDDSAEHAELDARTSMVNTAVQIPGAVTTSLL